MKKLSIIVILAVMTAVTLFSCKDESGEFVEQLYTIAQKEKAIKQAKKLLIAEGIFTAEQLAS